ncbi:GGDEF domain-containing protein [Devosia lacusdianchii]|uniref:GGDEF domain-containing protein n=1 Tax=Devosia lacusdianchii TaxID=2917991 RepID=UPI001F0557B0|nr:GGDEF domain-containing protein [Devosia sp. JXJ CY 41]
MFFHWGARSGATHAIAAPSRQEHKGIKTIGRLVQICAGVLLLSAALLIGTALQVVNSIDRADLEAERLRAGNAIDAMTMAEGPLTEARAVLLGRMAGLHDAHLATKASDSPSTQHIPLLGGQGPRGSYLVWTRTGLGHKIFLQFAPIRLPIIAGMLLTVLAVLLRTLRIVGDIERQRHLAHLQSRCDAMTGLANRLALDARMTELAIARTRFAVVGLDLDRFKDINDAYGHAAGDTVLREVASRLAALMEPQDLLARVGGDEFVMVLVSRPDIAALTELARQSIAAVERPIRLDERSVMVGVSLGIVPPVATAHLPSALVDMADAALYRAKSRFGSAFNFVGEEPAAPRQPMSQTPAWAGQVVPGGV